MVYRRRYFPALTITTISYAPKSITAEKIADGAVSHAKVAPDAIDSERVIDESLKSVDIKDGEIKTPDLASGAVTTEKIALGAVTPEKLSVSVLTRPISPGVTTAEILDGNVTLGKLAPNSVNASKIVAGGVGAAALAGDAVETAKIKDLNVTLDKLAPDSIDNTKIKANTIRGTEIATGAVGVTELGTDSVQTVKVKGRNITSPKIALEAIIPELIAPGAVTEPKLGVAALSRRHIESLNVREAIFHDPCIGPPHGGPWISEGDPGGFWAEDQDGRTLETDNVSGKAQRIRLKGVMDRRTLLEVLPSLNVGLGYATTKTYVNHLIGFYYDVNNYVAFVAEELAGVPTTWEAQCIKGGVSSVVDTGIAVDSELDEERLLLIEFQSDGSVKFFVDGIEKVHITDNQYIPDEEYEVRLEVITRQAALARMRTRFIDLYEKRF